MKTEIRYDGETWYEPTTAMLEELKFGRGYSEAPLTKSGTSVDCSKCLYSRFYRQDGFVAKCRQDGKWAVHFRRRENCPLQLHLGPITRLSPPEVSE